MCLYFLMQVKSALCAKQCDSDEASSNTTEAATLPSLGTSLYRLLSKAWGKGISVKPLASAPSLYEVWLRAVTRRTGDTEVNFQTAEFSLRSNPMHLLESWVNDYPDFTHLFGRVGRDAKSFQCAIVAATRYR